MAALSEMVDELQPKEFMILPVDENIKIHKDNEGAGRTQLLLVLVA